MSQHMGVMDQRTVRPVQEPVSLELPVGDEEAMELGALIEDSTVPETSAGAIAADFRAAIRKNLCVLSPRQEMIVRMRFGMSQSEESTLDELGELLSMTRERVRQIEQQALRDLRFPKAIRKTPEAEPTLHQARGSTDDGRPLGDEREED